MSSVGQVAGMVVGGVAGSFVGMPMLGASIGGAIGGYIDPPKGQDSIGPRLEDLTVQTSTYGAILPRVKGTIAVTGNVFWLEGDKLNEHKNTKKVGGKGGPTAKQTTFNYTATFAVGLSHQINGPIKGIKRLWLANKLVYDAGAGDIESIIASNQQAGLVFKFYDGRDDQEPDPRMQADKGMANVSGYPGRCYIVFYDLDLTEKYNNTLMTTQVKVELTTGTPSYGWLSESLPGAWSSGPGRHIYSAKFDQTGVSYCVINHDSWTNNPVAAEFYRRDYGIKTELTTSFALTGYNNNPHHITVCQGDEPMGILLDGWSTTDQLSWVTASGVVYSPVMDQTVFPYRDYSASVKGADTFLTYRSNAPIYKFSSFALVATSSASYQIKSSGLSESYLFGIYDPNIASSSTTVYKFSRADLSLVSTYTQSVPGTWAAINVIDDDTFFTLTATTAYKWVGGVVVASYPGLFPDTGEQGEDSWFSMVNESPVYAAYTRDNIYYGTRRDVFIGYETLTAGVAKLHDIVIEEGALSGVSSADIDLTELTNYDVRGYRAASVGSVRSILEQLQAAFPFDVVQSGYKIKFKDRGGAAVLTVPESDLGAHTGNDTPSRFMLTTEMPSQVPAKVTFNFLNADREYDPDEQSASFTAQEVKNSYTVSLPLVMTPTEALQAADVLLKKEQRERTVAGTFWLPPSDAYRKLEAADVIDVVAQGRTHTLRLTKVSQLPDGRIECDGKLTSSAAYASTAQAQNSLALGQSGLTLDGPSELLLLDIPRVVSDQDVPGVVLGMYGYTTGWPGGVVMRSDDYGESYNAITAFDTKTETFMVAGLPATVSPQLVDAASALVVTPAWIGADLSSLSDAQFSALGNLAAYGAPGRWELICFKTVADNGNGTYTLRDFMRGRFGTEWAMGMHAAGDTMVMLDITRADFAGLPFSAINSPRLWRGVTLGASFDSVADESITYTAENLRPLSPVYVKGAASLVSGDWTVEATRRTRWIVEPFSGIEQPLGEAVERYRFEFYDATFSTLKHSATVTGAPAYVYSGAQQIIDFGAKQTTVYLRVVQLSETGVSYYGQVQITDTGGVDLLVPYMVFGLHFDGTNGSTTYTDVKGHSVVNSGTCSISTAWYKFGGSSFLCPGGGNHAYINYTEDLNLSTADFTISCWAKFNSLSGGSLYGTILSKRNGGGDHDFTLFNAGGTIAFSFGDTSSGSRGIGGGTVVVGNEYYIEVNRYGSLLMLHVNGVFVASITISGSIRNRSLTTTIGKSMTYGDSYLSAYIDDLQILKGDCRRKNTSNFDVPTSPFADS